MLVSLFALMSPGAAAAAPDGTSAAAPVASTAAVPARILLSRTSARAGQRVVVRGVSFPREMSVRVSLGGRRVDSVRTDRRGRFESSFRLARLTPGRRSLIAETRRTRVTARFTVLRDPRLLLSRSSARPGQRVRVEGRDFPKRSTVRIGLAGRTVARSRTTPGGRFSLLFRVRTGTAGEHRLLAVSGKTRVSATFTVLGSSAPAGSAPPVLPAPDVAPAPVPAPDTSQPAPGTPQPGPADPVVAAAGDIACDPGSPSYNGGAGTANACRQRAVSDLIVDQSLSRVLTLGDHQYEDDPLSKYLQVFDPTWGRVKSLISPVVGNHEYLTEGAKGYFDYFNGVGQQTGPAGDRSRGYYSYDIGAWHVIALNSNCAEIGGCGSGSPQREWLQADLASRQTSCTLAYFHHPRFTSGGSGTNNASVRPLWQTLYDADADLILSAHQHMYERYAPQDPDGQADDVRGIRQFVVGTGGRSLHSFTNVQPNAEVRNNTTFGVLKLRLAPTSYDWQFVPEAGASFTDRGSQSCH